MQRTKRGWRISRAVKHNLAPAYFAYEFAKAKAKSFGLPWRCKVKIESTARPGIWYGHAYGKKGIGRIFCRFNHAIQPSDHQDWRFKNQPRYSMWGTEEVICFLFAHEFGHVIGWDGDKAGEMACNQFGYDCVIAYRARQYQSPAALI